MSISALVLLGLLLAAAVWAIAVYNGLVRARNGFRNAFAQIDVQLGRRHDLVPNLVETAKGYLAHERDTLEAVIQARAAAVGGLAAAKARPGDDAAMAALGQAEAGLAGALSRLMMVSEAYPDLKADAVMTRLFEELVSTDNRIAFARQAYNDAVMGYNNAREVFPASVVAGIGGFAHAAPLEIADPAQRAAPKVAF